MSVLQRIVCAPLVETDPHALRTREWLVTNGLGGYASGTLSGACTRRYHSLLVAALPAPLGRMNLFNHLADELKLKGRGVSPLNSLELAGEAPAATMDNLLVEFRLEWGLPVWHYAWAGLELEKRVWLAHLQNTVFISYRLLQGPDGVRLRLRPSFHFRPHEGPVSGDAPRGYIVSSIADGIEVHSESTPPLRLSFRTAQPRLVLDEGRQVDVQYRLEAARGYDSRGSLWSPGYFRCDLRPGEEATLIASTEPWDMLRGLVPAKSLAAELQRRERLVQQAPPAARESPAADLVLAADQFLIHPSTRTADAALARAAGEEAQTVIAGYHWFTDWGRDTMISLEGLTLATGRTGAARDILRTFARYVRNGLIPNLFPEGEREGLYHTADGTLWYFHALGRYLQHSGDHEIVQQLLPTLTDILEQHLRGTRFGIGVDPADGLLSQGAEGLQLTWMDAKVGDWVVTPRRGKAVEINALWYNALRLQERWSRETGNDLAAQAWSQHAERAYESFNRRFWLSNDHQYLADVIDGEGGDDAAFRPNQIFAISLDHPVLAPERWTLVVDQVAERLLTPYGLRTLAPGHPDYRPTYDGDLRSRDAAYHQGTVWAWLIGHFVDAWLRIRPGETAQARQLLAGFEPHLREACVGSVSEVFDAEAPFYPRGCVAQAWSVAEVLRAWLRTAPTAIRQCDDPRPPAR